MGQPIVPTLKDKLLAMLEAFPEVKRKVLGLVEPVAAHGGDRKGEESSIAPILEKTSNTTAEGILARLKRDHPEIAQATVAL